MILLSFLFAIAGLAAMGMSQPRHHHAVLRRRLSPHLAPVLRWSGLAIAALGLWPAMIAWGAACGAVGWTGLLSLAAFSLLLARTYLLARD